MTTGAPQEQGLPGTPDFGELIGERDGMEVFARDLGDPFGMIYTAIHPKLGRLSISGDMVDDKQPEGVVYDPVEKLTDILNYEQAIRTLTWKLIENQTLRRRQEIWGNEGTE